jgi:hypothetical protein
VNAVFHILGSSNLSLIEVRDLLEYVDPMFLVVKVFTEDIRYSYDECSYGELLYGVLNKGIPYQDNSHDSYESHTGILLSDC